MSPLNECRLLGATTAIFWPLGVVAVPFVMYLLHPWWLTVFVLVWCGGVLLANLRYCKVYNRIPQDVRDRLENRA